MVRTDRQIVHLLLQSHDTVFVVTCVPSQLLGMSLEELLWPSFGAGLGPTRQDAGHVERDLILQAEMNYFSLTSKAVLHTSFLRVMGSIFSPAVDWGQGNIPALRATTSRGKHLPGIPLPVVLLLLLLSVSCCNRSCIYWLLMPWVGDQIASYKAGRLEGVGGCSHI